MAEKVLIDSQGVQELLAHRYPFLMIDRITVVEEGKRLVAEKGVTINEPFFQGHFPQKPVMPGVLILEAMAQASACLAYLTPDGLPRGNLIYLVGADKMRWKKQVVPGDRLVIEVEFAKFKRPVWFMDAKALVDGEVVCTGELRAVDGGKQH